MAVELASNQNQLTWHVLMLIESPGTFDVISSVESSVESGVEFSRI